MIKDITKPVQTTDGKAVEVVRVFKDFGSMLVCWRTKSGEPYGGLFPIRDPLFRNVPELTERERWLCERAIVWYMTAGADSPGVESTAKDVVDKYAERLAREAPE